MSEKLPIIVVCSEGARTSQEIIDSKYFISHKFYFTESQFIVNFVTIFFSTIDLRKEPADQNTIDLGNGVIGYKFHNVTKYYENDLVFLSHESKHINVVPIDLLDCIEGVIVYFDSDNVSSNELFLMNIN